MSVKTSYLPLYLLTFVKLPFCPHVSVKSSDSKSLDRVLRKCCIFLLTHSSLDFTNTNSRLQRSLIRSPEQILYTKFSTLFSKRVLLFCYTVQRLDLQQEMCGWSSLKRLNVPADNLSTLILLFVTLLWPQAWTLKFSFDLVKLGSAECIIPRTGWSPSLNVTCLLFLELIFQREVQYCPVIIYGFVNMK
jgi:hypothetical protein